MIKYYWIELETQLYVEYEYSYEGIEETQVQVTTRGEVTKVLTVFMFLGSN